MEQERTILGYKINVMIPRPTYTEGRTYRFKTEKNYKRWLARLESLPKTTVSVWLHGPILSEIVLDYSQIEDVEVDGIDHRDHPDYVDAYIASATYKGREMTDSELDALNGNSSFVYDCVQERLY